MPKAPETKTAEPTLYVVKSGFYAEPTPYLEGEVIHPDDPYLKVSPERFAVFVFPHPIKGHRLATPEVRS